MENNINLDNSSFENIKHLDSTEEEFWYARELMSALGYETWESFHRVIKKAIISMSKVYPQIEEHFREITKEYKIAAGKRNESKGTQIDYKLTRYACYLIAQNGDASKEEIAFAQTYFATQTRLQELDNEREKAIERIVARRKLRETEKKFSGVLTKKGLSGKDIAEVRSAGDESLFDMSTREIKEKLGIKGPIADHLPTITIKAKDLATEITTFNTITKERLNSKTSIKNEHKDNNRAVRKILNERGIYPEKLAIETDISKLERRISEEELSRKTTNDFIGMSEIIIDIIGVNNIEEISRIKDLINNSNGDVMLKIIYGSKTNPKLMLRKISITKELLIGLKKYIVIDKNA